MIPLVHWETANRPFFLVVGYPSPTKKNDVHLKKKKSFTFFYKELQKNFKLMDVSSGMPSYTDTEIFSH